MKRPKRTAVCLGAAALVSLGVLALATGERLVRQSRQPGADGRPSSEVKRAGLASGQDPLPVEVQPSQYYFPPPGEGLEAQSRRTPEQVRLDSGVIAALHGQAERWALWRYGYLVGVEGEWNRRRDVKSLRKTWFALGVGAAIGQGRIPSYDQKLSVWEQDLRGNDALATWRHVMTQSSAFDYPYDSQPDYRPGEIWAYSDKNAKRLCSALGKVYGQRDYRNHFEDVLKAAYFDAIGMRGWGIKFADADDGVRLQLDLDDMGRLGLLVLARGRWNQTQVVPQWFVEELETKQTSGMKVNYNGPDDGDIGLDSRVFPEAPYGYMTWVNTDGRYFSGADRAWAWGAGALGNVVLWNRNNGIVYAAQGLKSGSFASGSGIPHLIERFIRS